MKRTLAFFVSLGLLSLLAAACSSPTAVPGGAHVPTMEPATVAPASTESPTPSATAPQTPGKAPYPASQPTAVTYPAAPSEVVTAFLRSLQTDPSGASSKTYLASSTRDALGTKPVISLLGVQNLWQSATVTEAPALPGGTPAANSRTVQIALQYATSTEFRLVRLQLESNFWRITDITPLPPGVTPYPVK